MALSEFTLSTNLCSNYLSTTNIVTLWHLKTNFIPLNIINLSKFYSKKWRTKSIKFLCIKTGIMKVVNFSILMISTKACYFPSNYSLRNFYKVSILIYIIILRHARSIRHSSCCESRLAHPIILTWNLTKAY